ncbi:MAG TPA: hypothetical protein VJ201_03215 [Candidatus Babeliales bacterium]|nr:hypothetical protein [Candidatus Babeliales bacterium]
MPDEADVLPKGEAPPQLPAIDQIVVDYEHGTTTSAHRQEMLDRLLQKAEEK